MARALLRRRLAAAMLTATALTTTALGALPASAATPSSTSGAVLAPGTRLYVPKAPEGSQQQISQLVRKGDRKDAALVKAEVNTAQAVWFTSGTPQQVKQGVKQVVQQAAGKKTVPVLVAYDLPYRDCGQYSSGGAADTAAYDAWIDALAAGIGNHKAVVILEPDGLGLVPNYVSDLDGSSNCTIAPPAGVDLGKDPGAAPTPENRFAQLNHAVDALKAHASTAVYLDGTHNGWQNVGESADRLRKAGVDRANGFFLNVSNYQYTSNLTQYGDWVSKCLAHTAAVAGDYAGCPNQFWNGGPSNGFTGVALNNFGQWSDTATDPALNTKGINERYATLAGANAPKAHFVIDTSRNGQGPWAPPKGKYPDAQDWCNPPGRGLGELPTTTTGDPLMDAKLWIKTPGQSDGQCNRGVAGSTTDPEWGGITDPAAGAWFGAQALQLAQLAVPPLKH
jgi:endoglucanase